MRGLLLSGLVFVLLVSVVFSSEIDGAQGQQTPVVKRGLDWEDENLNGVHVSRFYSAAVNYFDGNSYVPIDTQVVLYSDPVFGYEVTKGHYSAYFKADSASEEVVKYVKDGVEIGFQPVYLSYKNDLGQTQQLSSASSVNGAASENSIIYEGIYGDGIDLKYVYTNYVLKELIYLQNFSVVSAPEQLILDGGNPVLDLDFVFTTNSDSFVIDGAEWDMSTTITTENAVQVKDSNGRVLYVLTEPYAYDANYDQARLKYQFKREGSKLYVVVMVPYRFLQEASYPVVIDPSIFTILASRTSNVTVACGSKSAQGADNGYPAGTNNASSQGYSDLSSNDANHMTSGLSQECDGGGISTDYTKIQFNFTIPNIAPSQISEFNFTVFVASYPGTMSTALRNQSSDKWEPAIALPGYGGGAPDGNDVWGSFNFSGSAARAFFTDAETVAGTIFVASANASSSQASQNGYWDYAYLTVLWSESAGISEAEGDAAISTAINSSLPAATSYSEQQAYLVNASGSHAKGTFDWVASYGSKRWLLSYVTDGESAVGAKNLSTAVFVREITTNMTSNQIIDAISTFINATK